MFSVLLKKYRINFYLAGDGKRKKIIKENHLKKLKTE